MQTMLRDHAVVGTREANPEFDLPPQTMLSPLACPSATLPFVVSAQIPRPQTTSAKKGAAPAWATART